MCEKRLPFDIVSTAGSCFWEKYKDDSKTPYSNWQILISDAALILTTLFSFRMWNNNKHKLRNITSEESYKLFERFIWAVHLRTMIPKLCRHRPKTELDELCVICGVLDTFMSVFEMEALTHVCIERYVLAKYNTNGWPINKNHYKMYFKLCVFFATLYSFLPVFGVGGYALDFACDVCAFDMILPKSGWKRQAVTIIWLLRSVKPVLFMITMLHLATKLESRFTNELKNDVMYTQLVIQVAMGTVGMWVPQAIMRAAVLMSQHTGGPVCSPPSSMSRFFLSAPTLYELTPLMTTIAVCVTFAREEKRLEGLAKAREEKDQ